MPRVEVNEQVPDGTVVSILNERAKLETLYAGPEGDFLFVRNPIVPILGGVTLVHFWIEMGGNKERTIFLHLGDDVVKLTLTLEVQTPVDDLLH